MYVIPPLIPKVFFQLIVLPRFPYLYSLFLSTWLDSNQRLEGFADLWLDHSPTCAYFGTPGGTRIPNLFVRSEVLIQLSYEGISLWSQCESNAYRRNRNPKFCPLNYGTISLSPRSESNQHLIHTTDVYSAVKYYEGIYNAKKQ